MDKELILSRAKSASIARDFPLAIKLYKSLLKEDPSDLNVLNQLGASFVKSGDDEKALLYYEQILTFSPHDIDAMNSLGAIYRRLKRYEESINILQRALDEDKNTVSVNYNLGFTYKEMGNFEDAIDAFNSVIDENPEDVLAHNHLGSIYYQEKNYAKSIECFKTGLQVDPNHPILQYNLAKSYEAENFYVEAVKCYETALKARPGWIEALHDFSELLIKCQKTEEARSIVKRTIDLKPNDAELYTLLGEIFLNEYDYDAAVASFTQADELENNNVRILTGLADALEKDDHPEEAISIMNKAMQIEPITKDVEKQYVHTCLSAEDYEEAYTHMNSLYNDNGKDDVQLLDLFGQYYICVGEDDNAKKYYDRIPEIDPQYKLHFLEAANRYNQIGKIHEAEELAKKYINSNPFDAKAYNALGKIYEKQGEKKSAAQSFAKGLKVAKNNIYARNKLKSLKDIAEDDDFELPDLSAETVSLDSGETIKKSLTDLRSAIEDQNEDFDFSGMYDDVSFTMDDLSNQVPDEDSISEVDQYRDEPDPNLDEVYDKYPTLPKNPGVQPPHYPTNGQGGGNSGGFVQGGSAIPTQVQSSDPIENFAQTAEKSLQNLDDKAAEYQKNLQEQFDEQSKQLEEKANDLINKVAEAGDKAEENRLVNEMKENIENQFEEEIAQALDSKKEFDFDESDSIIEDEAESGDSEMIDDETVQNEDFDFTDVDDLFEAVPEENAPVEEDSFDSVDDLFDENSAECETVEIPADEDSFADVEMFGEDGAVAEEVPVEAEEDDFADVDMFGEDDAIAEEVSVEAEEDTFADVEMFAEDDAVAEETSVESEEDSFADVDMFGEDTAVEEEPSVETEEDDFADVEMFADDIATEEPIFETEEAEPVDEAVAEEVSDVEELEELLDEVTEEDIQANIVNEDAPFEDIIAAAAEVANEAALTEQVDLEHPKDSFDFLDPLAAVRNFLPNLERILQDTDYAHAHATELELFIKMKQFCEFLPGSELDMYRSSKIRMLLDYLIARFSGKPGLLVTTESLMKAGMLGEGMLEQVYEKEVTLSYEEQVRTVLEYMKKLTNGLTSRHTAEALCAEADKVLEEMKLKNM